MVENLLNIHLLLIRPPKKRRLFRFPRLFAAAFLRSEFSEREDGPEIVFLIELILFFFSKAVTFIASFLTNLILTFPPSQ